MDVSNSLNDATEKELGSEISIPNLVPKIGLQFVSENHAYIFYNEYAGSIGFSVRKDFVNKCKEDEIVKSRREGMLELERLCVRKCDAFQNDKTKVIEGTETIKNKDGNEEVIVGDNLNNLKSKGLKKKERAPGGKRRLMSSLEQSLKKRKGGSNQLSTPNIIAGNQSSRTKIVSPPLPSNFVHSLSYQHPSYYQWQLPILNPQMECLQSSQETINTQCSLAAGVMVGSQAYSMLEQSSSFRTQQQNQPTIPYLRVPIAKEKSNVYALEIS
ncbi:Far1-related sequence 5 isoform 1 [Fagus crenata]